LNSGKIDITVSISVKRIAKYKLKGIRIHTTCRTSQTPIYDRIGKEMKLTQQTYLYMYPIYKHSIFTAVLYCIVYV